MKNIRWYDMARDSLKCRFSYLEWEGWVDQGLICTENVVGILEKIHESLAQCLNILDREGLSLEYDPLYDIYTRIARLREDYNNNWLYGCELANQVEKELDMPYYNAYVNGATEVISNIHVQSITTKNTLGLKDYDGREIDKLTLAAFLGLRDDEGVPSMSRQVVEEKQYYVEEFATLFAELYSDYQIDETGAELEEFLESLYEQGSFSHDIDDKELALWETVLSFSIIVPMIEAFTGEEMLTGNELSDFERIFSGAGAVVDIIGLGMTIKAVRRWWKLRKVDDVVAGVSASTIGYEYLDDQLGNLKGKVKINQYQSAESVNDWWEARGYKSPYKEKTVVQNITLTEDVKFVRVYDGVNSNLEGGWVMRTEDIKGLTPKEIQAKFALEYEPRFIGEVELKAGDTIRLGEVGPNFGFDGGGIQIDLQQQWIGEFTELGKIEDWR